MSNFQTIKEMVQSELFIIDFKIEYLFKYINKEEIVNYIL